MIWLWSSKYEEKIVNRSVLNEACAQHPYPGLSMKMLFFSKVVQFLNSKTFWKIMSVACKRGKKVSFPCMTLCLWFSILQNFMLITKILCGILIIYVVLVIHRFQPCILDWYKVINQWMQSNKLYLPLLQGSCVLW